MTPYYQDDRATIYCGDCREILPTLGAFDLLLTDPPYGINYKPEGGGKGKNGKEYPAKRFTNADCVIGDGEIFNPACILELAENMVVWGGSNFADQLPATRGWLVWDKKCGINRDNQFSDCELAWTNWNRPIKLYTHRWTGYNRDSERDTPRQHPTQKPIDLMRWCITLAGDIETIIDPFMGSGTTLHAAKLEGKHATGIEIEEKYCEIAARRLEQGVLF